MWRYINQIKRCHKYNKSIKRKIRKEKENQLNKKPQGNEYFKIDNSNEHHQKKVSQGDVQETNKIKFIARKNKIIRLRGSNSRVLKKIDKNSPHHFHQAISSQMQGPNGFIP